MFLLSHLSRQLVCPLQKGHGTAVRRMDAISILTFWSRIVFLCSRYYTIIWVMIWWLQIFPPRRVSNFRTVFSSSTYKPKISYCSSKLQCHRNKTVETIIFCWTSKSNSTQVHSQEKQMFNQIIAYIFTKAIQNVWSWEVRPRSCNLFLERLCDRCK